MFTSTPSKMPSQRQGAGSFRGSVNLLKRHGHALCFGVLDQALGLLDGEALFSKLDVRHVALGHADGVTKGSLRFTKLCSNFFEHFQLPMRKYRNLIRYPPLGQAFLYTTG
jgi:hypothetical protein